MIKCIARFSMFFVLNRINLCSVFNIKRAEKTRNIYISIIHNKAQMCNLLQFMNQTQCTFTVVFKLCFI